MSNADLMTSLAAWARNHARIDPDHFGCRFFMSCDAAAGGRLGPKQNVLMSYVGARYGDDIGGAPFKIVMVGIDHGEATSENYDRCRDGIEAHCQKGGRAFNQHYAGVLKTAAAAYGSAASQCASECAKACQRRQRDARSFCALDHFAQPNLAKCVLNSVESRTSETNGTMIANCANRLAEELRLLKPNLVVFHSAQARDSIPAAFRASGVTLEKIERPDLRGATLYVCAEWAAHLLFAKHPGHGHLTRTWDAEVAPAFHYLRSRGVLPI